MVNVGDKVKIDIESLGESGFPDSQIDTQVAAYQYILEHPGETYLVSDKRMPMVAASVTLDHEILGKTSFFMEELIKVGDNE